MGSPPRSSQSQPNLAKRRRCCFQQDASAGEFQRSSSSSSSSSSESSCSGVAQYQPERDLGGFLQIGLKRVSKHPNLWLSDRFASPAECAVLRGAIERGVHGEGRAIPTLDRQEEAVLEAVAQRLGLLLGTPPHPRETPMAARRTPPTLTEDRFPLGLHVDTYQGSRRRFATGLLYLTSGVHGGETIFPLAEAEDVSLDGVRCCRLDSQTIVVHRQALSDAQLLLRDGYFHTTDASTSRLGENGYEDPPADVEAAAARFLSWASDGSHEAPGVSIAPREGRLLLFFTRTADGNVDPHSWHGGSHVSASGSAKLTAQGFKEIPFGIGDDETDFARYIAPRLSRLPP